MHPNLIRILTGLRDLAIVEDADVGRLIVKNAGLQRRTIEQYHNFLTEQKLIWRISERKYRVDRKKIRKMLKEAGIE